MVDRYTKSVLTMIAFLLAIIAFRGLPLAKTASAQDGPIHVIVDQVDRFAFRFTTVPVKIQN